MVLRLVATSTGLSKICQKPTNLIMMTDDMKSVFFLNLFDSDHKFT